MLKDTEKTQSLQPIPFRHDSRLSSVSSVLEAIELYFDKCDERGMSYTVPGLAFFLNVADTRLLFSQDESGGMNRKSPENAETIKLFTSPAVKQALRLAWMRIQAQRASQLLDHDHNTQAKIFDLKATFGWQDKQAISVENPDGNLGSKAIVVMPCEPNSLTMDQWQKFYDSMIESREEAQKLFLEEC